MSEFLADFKLTDLGELVLSRFGEAADDRIMNKAYPVLWKAMLSDEAEGLNENSKRISTVDACCSQAGADASAVRQEGFAAGNHTVEEKATSGT